MNEYFLNVEDVMEIGGMKKGAAYRLIREVNADLKKQGVITMPGKVSKAALFDKLRIKEGSGNNRGE